MNNNSSKKIKVYKIKFIINSFNKQIKIKNLHQQVYNIKMNKYKIKKL